MSLCLVLGLRRFKGECNIYKELLLMYKMYLTWMHANTINGNYSWKSVAISICGSVMFILWMSTKRIKNEDKAHLKQPAMDMHLLYFFKRSLDPLYLFHLHLQLKSKTIGCRLGHSLSTLAYTAAIKVFLWFLNC